MAPELRLGAAVVVSALIALLLTPLAIRVAKRQRFLDVPQGYKGHSSPTPYLGGAAALCAFLAGALVFAGDLSRCVPIAVGAIFLGLVGTIDDRVSLPPLIRVLIEVELATALWMGGMGWSVSDNDSLNLVLTILWIVGIVNAFNLMDNMDGAAASLGAVCSVAIGVLALINSDITLATFAFCLAAACAAFLRYNFTSPARIFLGDGGSMPIGFIVGACTILAVQPQFSGLTALNVAVLLVGIPIFDTALVVVSRRRRGAAILKGARDHLTHRLRARVHSTRRAVITLAVAQALLCAGALVFVQVERLELSLFVSLVALGSMTALVAQLKMPPQAA